MPDSSALDAVEFSVTCPNCGATVATTVGDRRSTLACPECGTRVDLTTDEVRHARQSAAAKATIEAHTDGG